jgi:hypothetical protein
MPHYQNSSLQNLIGKSSNEAEYILIWNYYSNTNIDGDSSWVVFFKVVSCRSPFIFVQNDHSFFK